MFRSEHAARQTDPGQYETFRRSRPEGWPNGLEAIWGIKAGKSEIQSIRADASKWTVERFRAWLADHGFKTTIEAAKPKNEEMAELAEQLPEWADHGTENPTIATTNFAGSPRSKYGTHGSKGFKGNYAAAWRIHFSQVGGGSLSPGAAGPIRGTVHRVSQIAGGMKPPCELPDMSGVPARSGGKSPLPGSFPKSPKDYGLSSWASPSDDNLTREDIQLTCKDLGIIKRAAQAEVHWRAKQREAEGKMTELTEAYHDDRGNLCLLRQLPPGKDPPTELVLFEAGINATTKGDLLFDDESVRRTREFYEDKGQERLPWDYDHGMMSFISSAETGKAAGWWTPEWGEDGSLTATDIEWTPAADKGIRDKEWMFYSPAVKLLPSGLNDGDPMRVVKIVNAAITNLPATKRQRPMMASETQPGGPGATREDEETMSTELLKLLGAKTEAEAITALAARLQLDGALFTALGVNGIEELLPAIEKLKATAATATGLADKVRELTGKLTDGERETLITQLNDAGKLPEALHDWARTQDLESLKKFGDAAPVHPKYKAHEAGDKTTVVLSDAQKEAAKQLGYTEEEYAEAVLANDKAEADLRSGRNPSTRKEG